MNILNEVLSMNNKWEKDCYYCVLSYMLVQTIQSDFSEGTEDILRTMKKLLDFPIQPLKRIYMQECFLEKAKEQPKPAVKKFHPKSSIPKKINFRGDHRSKSIQKKLGHKENKNKEEDRKIKMYFDHIIANQKLNGMEVNPYGNTRFLKFVIGKGNNSILARVALKTRWWWAEVKKNGFNFNFIWTQWKSNKVVNHLPIHEEENGKSNDLKDDTTKNSDTEDISSSQSFKDTIATPTPAKLKRINSDSASRKLNTPESLSRSEKKSSLANNLSKADQDPMDTENTIICNHVEGHAHLSNKKALFYNIKNYYQSINEDPFKFIPLTFHIKENLEDKEFDRFVEEFERLDTQDREKAEAMWQEKKKKAKPTNIWIIKPGENTNRGSGIRVCNTLEQIRNIGGRKFNYSWEEG
jgi:hypothetical protein